jgi:hypothetical protein
MKIDNFRVYDLNESIVASGLPMLAEYDKKKIDYDLHMLYKGVINSNHFKRACKLANTPLGSGHGNFLSGILVSANITASVKWWEQFQRYHFKQIVSSQSTMHRLRKMVEENTISFNDKTDKNVINAFLDLAKDESVTDEQLAYSCPMGLELTARVTTNYLQLKTMYHQRKNHKLKEWHDFCDWVESLPCAKEFIIGEAK